MRIETLRNITNRIIIIETESGNIEIAAGEAKSFIINNGYFKKEFRIG